MPVIAAVTPPEHAAAFGAQEKNDIRFVEQIQAFGLGNPHFDLQHRWQKLPEAGDTSDFRTYARTVHYILHIRAPPHLLISL
jgi:hypothetical protein